MFKDSVSVKAMGLFFSYGSFRSTYNFLKKSQYWSLEELENYQLVQLGDLLDHCYDNVPYYRRVFDERGLKPEDIKDLKDLNLLPLLTKEIIRDNVDDLKATNFSEDKFEYVTTGGSSGEPLGFYYEKGVSRAQEWAFIKTLWDRVGYNFRDKCVVLKGDVVKSADEGKYWKKTFFGRWLILSSYHMTEDNLWGYVEKIREFKPKFVQAYPSTISILARFMEKNNLEPFESLKAILCGSENIYKHQRELLEKVFDCRIYTWYGHSERCILAGECEKSSNYHIFPEYGIFELLDNNGDIVTKPGIYGTIVGTNLTNYVMPLIRYKTDDMTFYTNKNCNYGRNYVSISNVKGRWTQEFIVANNRRLIPITAINMHSDIFDNVWQFQFYQEKEGELIFKVVRKDSYNENDTKIIRREIQKKLGSDMSLKIVFIDEIPRTNRGKCAFLVQKLPLNINYKRRS